jgi:hypothetical protein
LHTFTASGTFGVTVNPGPWWDGTAPLTYRKRNISR